jgi:CRP-like cAMP-binding protein
VQSLETHGLTRVGFFQGACSGTYRSELTQSVQNPTIQELFRAYNCNRMKISPTSAGPKGSFKTESDFKNTLLRRFSAQLIERLRLKKVVFEVGREIEDTGKPIDNLYFLEEGMASMTTTFGSGRQVEVGMFGFESVIGVSALMGTKQSLNRVYTQVAGRGYSCKLERAQEEFNNSALFQRLTLRYVQAQLVQATQSAACNTTHNFEQRLSRWLLITADRANTDQFKMSQEFLAHMLGGTRPTVTVAAGHLKKEKLIAYRHGTITILDRKGLEKRSCECYQIIRDHLANWEAFDTGHMA